jgi:hypothetical protein
MLIYSWNHSQIICYALLKLLLTEVIKKNENEKNVLENHKASSTPNPYHTKNEIKTTTHLLIVLGSFCQSYCENRKLHFDTRRLYFIIFLYLNSYITEILFNEVFKSNNKKNYLQTKQILSHCIIDTKTCALSGWVLLGLYFYASKRYNTAIHVIIRSAKGSQISEKY